jgi:hypothetical protein
MILIVQNYSIGKFRLKVSKEDSTNIFRKRYVPVELLFPGKEAINTETTSGQSEDSISTSRKKGFYLFDTKLSEWIIEKGYDKYESGQPTKLVFNLTTPTAKETKISLRFLYRLPHDLQFHKAPLQIIKDLEKPMAGILRKRSFSIDGLKAEMKPAGKQFSVHFLLNAPAKGKKAFRHGTNPKKVEFMKAGGRNLIFENFFVGIWSPSEITGYVDFLYSKGYSKIEKYYYRLIIPLKEELRFHYQIQRWGYSTDLGYNSSTGTRAKVNGDTILVSIIHNDNKEYFLAIESKELQRYDSFSDKAFAVKNGLGWMTGYLAGDKGYFFAYTDKKLARVKHFYHCAFRDTIKGPYTPIHTNPYSYPTMKRNSADKWYKSKTLRPLNFNEFSTLCQRVYDSIDFQVVILLMLESSVASLVFMPGGFSIAIENLADIIIGARKLKLAPMKDKQMSKTVRGECTEVINKHCSTLPADDLQALKDRISHINQVTNKARLRAPFELQGISLSNEDLSILETRNDFLHGRIPDITDAGKCRPLERRNKDLFYASMRFYTLLNILILKWIGFDNYVVNHPKINEKFCEIGLKEDYYRKV